MNMMIFRCRNCGSTTTDMDTIIDGTCDCGSTRFQIVTPAERPDKSLSLREVIRRDLHMWIDLNLDSMTNEQLTTLRVRFEFPQSSSTINSV